MYGIERPNIFKGMLPKESWPNQEEEENEEKIRRALRSCKGNNFEDLHLFQGTYWISKILGHSGYELKDEQETIRGEFKNKELRKYKEELPSQNKELQKQVGKKSDCEG
jgi:hypothetical protein